MSKRYRDCTVCETVGEAQAPKKQRMLLAGIATTSEEQGTPIELVQARGFAVVPAFLTAEELEYLRRESDELFAALHDNTAIATQKVVDQGCVLDAMADYPMGDRDQARIDQRAYMAARRAAMPIGVSPGVNGSELVRRLLFERLPQLVGPVLTVKSNPSEDSGEDLFFFNEHYVVKPPRTVVEFRWHRDDDEQLAMCVHRDSISPYVSVWCALDDVTAENGPLQFVPLNDALHDADNPVELEEHATAPILVQAGAVILFLSNVWHCSSNNTSETARRAFYAQYSGERITATASGRAPLSLAIPCGSRNNVEASSNDQ